MIRLQKYLSQAGVASRRASEKIILQGKVKVNDKLITEMGHVVDEDNDIITVDDNVVKLKTKNIYIVLNKPTGYITTVSDDKGRKTIMDLVSEIPERIYPVGRLDYDTEGLLIMTNDGDVTYKLTHPKHDVDKTYIAEVGGTITMDVIQKLRSGVEIDGYKTSPAKGEVLGATTYGTKIEITIHEGKNRQVRNMFEVLGFTVNKLKRTQEAGIFMGHLASGKWRRLSEPEINLLKKGGITRAKSIGGRSRRTSKPKSNNKSMGRNRNSK